ncbi:MAG: cupin domain-containing protein [Crocinitomicaceae bacterium]|nr:cupin domain-containing protein [Crocinitomicaceae bacterium]
MSQQRIQELVTKFNLQAHPEGGFYSETYRSDQLTASQDRNLVTCIYFLLTSENVSNFHRIKSDEMWFFHEGSSLTVHTLDPQNGHLQHAVGNEIQKGQTPQLVVPKNTIFGSSVTDENSYSFVSCVVAPGFDFNDFELFTRDALLEEYPEEFTIIERLTVG